MSDRLLLLARRFPYNHGEVAAESYLETEIGLLAEHFDSVVAVATEAPAQDSPTCPLPRNVEPLALGCTPTKAHKLSLAVRGQLYALHAPERVHDAMKADSVRAVRKRLFRGYFAARAQEKYLKLLVELKDRDFTPTSIYSFWFYDTALVALWLKAIYPCARAIARAHGYDLYQDRTGVGYLPFREVLLAGLDMVLPCSEDGRSYIDANWPGHSEKLLTAYLGTIDLPDKSNAHGSGAFHIVSCSRVVDVKRVGLIAEALRFLDSDGISLRWTHYGDGPKLDEIKNACLGFTSVAAEFPGNVPNTELLRLYGDMDIDLFINVSASEGLPISIMEACGFGVPILATDVGGTHEIVLDGVNGRLLPEKPSATQVADSIKKFIDMPAEAARRMRSASRQIWGLKFRASKNVASLKSLLKGGEVA